jgi:hypothetical protein
MNRPQLQAKPITGNVACKSPTQTARRLEAASFAHRRNPTHRALLLAIAMIGLCADASGAYAAGKIISWGAADRGIGTIPAGDNFVAASAGVFFSVALRADGSLASWGDDSYGQVSGTPAGNNFAAASAGGYHSVALRSDGSLVSWGDNITGQVSATPAGNNFIAVSAGYQYSAALRSDGSLVCWGRGGVVAPAGNDFISVSAGDVHGVARRSDGSLVSWGFDNSGQVSGTPSGNNFIAASAGGDHSVALRSDGSLISWGDDTYGQVSGTPAGNNFIAVSAGFYHCVALRSDGSLVSWGYDIHFEISETPAGRGFIAVSGGGYHSLAIRANTEPAVDAGADQSITLPAEAVLDGTVTDDGKPSPPALTTHWSVGSGPGPVAFLDAAAVDTRASFTTAGTYVLRLTASDGALSSTDSVTIAVAPAPTPAAKIAALSDAVQALVTSGALLPAQGNSVQTKLSAANDLVARGNTQGAIGKLDDFVKQVSSLIKTGKLTSAQGQPLIDAAQAVIAQLQGSSSLVAQAVPATGSSLAVAPVPQSLRLYPGTADPARGAITLRFDLPDQSDVTLEFYDLAGRRIDEVRLGSLGPGQHERSWAPPNRATGLFFYRLTAGALMATGKVELMK